MTRGADSKGVLRVLVVGPRRIHHEASSVMPRSSKWHKSSLSTPPAPPRPTPRTRYTPWPRQDKPALDVAGVTIEAIVGVMRTMEGSGVFDILDPVEEDSEDAEDPSTFALDDTAAGDNDAADAADGAVGVSVDEVVGSANPLDGDGSLSSAVLDPTTKAWDVQSGVGGVIEERRNDDDDDDAQQEEEEDAEEDEKAGGQEGDGEKGVGMRKVQEPEEEEEDPRQSVLVAKGSDEAREAAGAAGGRGREGRSIDTSLKHGSAEWDRGPAAGGSWKSR